MKQPRKMSREWIQTVLSDQVRGLLSTGLQGLEILGKGKTKTAYALDKRDKSLVLKVGPGDRIIQQARRLRRLERHGVPVARVVLFGQGWLVQERCDLVGAPDWVVDQMHELAIAKGLFPHDLHDKNVGLLRGNWVILDCGALGKREGSEI